MSRPIGPTTSRAAAAADSPDAAAVRSGGLREVTELAYPVILTQISIVTMQIVDSAMVGRLGATELAAVGFGGWRCSPRPLCSAS